MVYTAPSTYFLYRNDPAIAETDFRAASFKTLKTLFNLAKHNLIHFSLIDLFHNLSGQDRLDQGRYLWMVDIIRSELKGSGAGRLHNHHGAVAFPNERLSGVGDWADAEVLEKLLDTENKTSLHLAPLRRFGNETPNFYLASYLGDYLLAWSLVTSSRYLRLGSLNWEDEGKVSSLSNILHAGFKYAFSLFTGVPEESAGAFLSAIINWDRMAKQMAYFMTPAYVEDLKTGQLPEGLYDSNVTVTIPHLRDIEKSRGWREKGWSFDGENPDLGPVNGPLPLLELVKALYLSTSFMIALQSEKALSRTGH